MSTHESHVGASLHQDRGVVPSASTAVPTGLSMEENLRILSEQDRLRELGKSATVTDAVASLARMARQSAMGVLER